MLPETLSVNGGERFPVEVVMPLSSENTFGRGVLYAATRLLEERFLDEDGSPDEKLTNAYANELRGVRQKLAELNTHQLYELGEYMKENAPSFLSQLKPDTVSWGEWIANSAADDMLINILEWHNHILENQQQDPVVKQAIEAYRTKTKEAIAEMVRDGYIVADINMLDKIEVKIYDLFDTLLTGCRGYYIYGSDYVVIAQGIGYTRQDRAEYLNQTIEEGLPHEWVHALLDKTRDTEENPLRPVWINEPLTEIIAMNIRGRGRESNLDDQTTLQTSYFEETDLLLDVLAGPTKVNEPEALLRQAVKAFTEGTESAKAFCFVLDELWGHTNVLAKVTQFIDQRHRMIRTEEPDAPFRAVRVKALEWVQDMILSNPDAVLKDETPTEERFAAIANKIK